jgi:hypothetical protein
MCWLDCFKLINHDKQGIPCDLPLGKLFQCRYGVRQSHVAFGHSGRSQVTPALRAGARRIADGLACRTCQGRGRGFESLRPLQDLTDLIPVGRCSQGNIWGNSVSANAYSVGRWSAYISSSLIQSLPTICDRTDGASRKSKPQSDRLLGLRHRDCGPRSQCSSAMPRSDSGKPSFHPRSMTVRTRYGARP